MLFDSKLKRHLCGKKFNYWKTFFKLSPPLPMDFNREQTALKQQRPNRRFETRVTQWLFPQANPAVGWMPDSLRIVEKWGSETQSTCPLRERCAAVQKYVSSIVSRVKMKQQQLSCCSTHSSNICTNSCSCPGIGCAVNQCSCCMCILGAQEYVQLSCVHLMCSCCCSGLPACDSSLHQLNIRIFIIILPSATPSQWKFQAPSHDKKTTIL